MPWIARDRDRSFACYGPSFCTCDEAALAADAANDAMVSPEQMAPIDSNTLPYVVTWTGPRDVPPLVWKAEGGPFADESASRGPIRLRIVTAAGSVWRWSVEVDGVGRVLGGFDACKRAARASAVDAARAWLDQSPDAAPWRDSIRL